SKKRCCRSRFTRASRRPTRGFRSRRRNWPIDMSTPVSTTVKDGVAVIAVDYPPVNALGPGVPAAISEAIESAERDSAVSAIVFMGAGKTFVAGADINSLERAAWGDREAACDLHPLLARIEDCAKPVVMA